jgi:hypothetical protein
MGFLPADKKTHSVNSPEKIPLSDFSDISRWGAAAARRQPLEHLNNQQADSRGLRCSGGSSRRLRSVILKEIS